MSPMSSRTRWLLGALSAWTVFLWVNRISNAWSSTTESTSAKVVSTVLAVSFLGFAVAGIAVLVRAWRAPAAPAPSTFVTAFASWTVVVWVVRIVAIVAADHPVGFEVVHAALGLVSILLAVALVRSVRPGAQVLSTADSGHR